MRTRGNGKSAKKKKRVAYSSQPAHLIQIHKITNHMLYICRYTDYTKQGTSMIYRYTDYTKQLLKSTIYMRQLKCEDFFFFFFFFNTNTKRVIAVARLRVAQPTYMPHNMHLMIRVISI
jgi:hypothetical protein